MAIDRSRPSLAMLAEATSAVFRRALDRAFDRRLGAVAYVLRTTLLSLATVVPVLLAAAFIVDAIAPLRADPPADATIVGALVVAPLIENVLLIGVAEFLLAFDLRTRTIVWSVALLSALTHGLADGLRAIGGGVMFATMTYTYLDWSASRFGKRYWMTVAQHVLFNLPIALWLFARR